MSGERYCYIDGCRKVATLVRHDYPDDVLLCDDHRHLHDGARDEWDASEPCGRPGPCFVCDDRGGE